MANIAFFAAEVLADNNRLNLVPKIAETFEEIIASARGQIKAVVTTAEVCRSLIRHPVVYYALHNYVLGSSCRA